MTKTREPAIAYKLMVKTIELFGDDKTLIGQHEDTIKKAIVNAFKFPEVAQFDVLYSLPAVQSLFPGSDHDSYEKWELVNKKVLENTGEDSERYHKLMYLMFVSHTFKDNKISYDEMAKRINIKRDEIEEFIIDAIVGNIINARIDQEHECIVVHSLFSNRDEVEIHKTELWPHVIKYIQRMCS